MIGVTKQAFADLTSSKLVQDFQVEGSHWNSCNLDNVTKSVTCIRSNRSDDKERDGKARDVVEDERAWLRRKSEALEVAAITADKQLEISPKEEFSGNGATGQKRGRAQRKLTAKGKKRNARARARAPTWPIEKKKKKSRLLAQRGERRETRSDGGRLREEKKNNKKENASSNSGRPTE
ncbi:hypothetical protein ALC57_17805 [Trachymyrmex cornetzi]|uniref:Uncharacterized protein n=1 Tax=Trachymyrmex cornetzi TaxID=471704 RepID=A0A195DB23_9HYME|nr:hypothetical protein ALC57_17805 [Trachymyrmex cornetzi]